ncbi:MAG: cbb3-type cytochrome oxidase subunit 3 [Burkholderiales bacterium]
MDINFLRSVMTVVLLAVFIGIVLWAWSGSRKPAFDAAARLPFDDEPLADDRRQGWQ